MSLRARLDRVRRAGWWKPAAAAYLLQNAGRHAGPLASDEASLRAAAEWLGRAQDATGDGGISGRYRLSSGWSSSYPETTGYAIPTLLTLAGLFGDDRYRERAKRCVDFLLSVQLASGAFPALEIGDNRTEPSPFNSAQIVHGLRCWLRATGDRRVLDPMMRAARWIADVQDDDGAWRRHFYSGLACTYSAHASCWLAEIAVDFDDAGLRAAAERNLRWVLQQRDRETHWFDKCGFSAEDHDRRRAYTHTIAYTLAGVLRLSECLNVPEGADAVRAAAERVLERLERSRTLAGVLNHQWRPMSRDVCLTGNAQFAVLWLQLAGTTGDARYASAAFKAIDQVKRAQSMASTDHGIRGGVPGSSPVGGDYIPYALPNWAAKFFIDALCAKRAWLDGAHRPGRLVRLEAGAAAGRAATVVTLPAARPVVVYTTRISPTFARLAKRWRARGFQPALVVVETASASIARQIVSALRRRTDDSVRICGECGWRSARVRSINAPNALAAIARTEPLVAVNAGAGILRQAALALPRLGTLNAHMGLLPPYRGMNVAEWAALNGDAIGCSVFWVDRGIDTGPVLTTRTVDVDGCRSIEELRARVDACQLAELDGVLQAIVEDGRVPPAVEQLSGAGRQFFRMHADLKQVLEVRLGLHADNAVSGDK